MTAASSPRGPEFLAYGPVHLNVIEADASLEFWRDLVGLRLRGGTADVLELGTEDRTLLVLHPGSTRRVPRGHTGLFHLALYVPGEAELARLLARLLARRARFGATDHVMAKSLYLSDPSGIGLELALETPQRFGSARLRDGVLEVRDAHGVPSTGNEPLDLEPVLAALPDQDLERPLPPGTSFGHLHLSVGDLGKSIAFYRDALGFVLQNDWPPLGMADFHAGMGPLHRLAINVWQGIGLPPAPAGAAGLRDFTLRYRSVERLTAALQRLPAADRTDRGYRVRDADGNTILLTNADAP